MSAISLKSFAVTAALGIAAIFSTAASSNAASLVVTPAVNMSQSSSVVNVGFRGRHHVRPVRRGPACSTVDARRKASRMGIRNARVIRRGRTVQVRGFRHGRLARAAFANVRGCPIIR